MKNLNKKTMTIEEMDSIQKDLVDKIQSKFKELGYKVDMSYTGLGYNVERDIIIKVYVDKYNYKEVSYIFNPLLSAEVYVAGALDAIKEEGKFKEHTATPEEIYMVELLESLRCKDLYVYEGILNSINCCDTVDLSSVEEMHYNKVEATITFIEDSGQKIIVNLATETITGIDANELVEEEITKWNRLNLWCSLKVENNTLFLLDNETNNKNELIIIDDIESINLKDKALFVNFMEEDENGFNSFTINEVGIEY